MKIGELAKLTGLTTSRIRFYESIGLLKGVQRQPNGYRRYPSEAAAMLQLITTAQQAVFTLDEMRTLLPVDLMSWDHHALSESLQNKLQDIDAMQQRLASIKRLLQQVLRDIESKPDDMSCIDNAKRVLSQFGVAPLAEKGAGSA